MAEDSANDIRLKKESEQLNLILSLMAEGLIVVHGGGAIALMNQTAGVLSRTAPEDGVGELFSSIFPFVFDEGAGEEPRFPVKDALEKETIVRIRLTDDWFVKRPDGTRFPVAMTVTPFISEEQPYAIVLLHDVTQEKEVDRAKTEFVSLASHQLKTPLSAINWFSEMLLSGDAGRIKKKQREYVEEVAKGAERMTKLVNELLNVSRLELGTFIVEPEEVDLRTIVQDVLRELAPRIKQKGHTIQESYPGELPQIAVDTTLTRIVFQNLLSNAVKYTPDGGTVRVSIQVSQPDMVITVEDNGLGIPTSQQEKIFTKFYRADNAIESEQEGTGLGLYILKAIMEETNGTIGFTSREGQGTTFRVTIPLEGMPEKKGTRQLT